MYTNTFLYIIVEAPSHVERTLQPLRLVVTAFLPGRRTYPGLGSSAHRGNPSPGSYGRYEPMQHAHIQRIQQPCFLVFLFKPMDGAISSGLSV